MRALSLALLWGGAGLALVASGQPWWSAGSSSETGSGATSGAASVLVLAAAAGAFLSSWLRRRAGRLVSCLVALLLVGAAVVAATAGAPVSLPGSALTNAAVTATPWRWVYLAGACVAALGATLSLFAAPRAARAAATPDPALDTWKALDVGQDPTLDPERAVGGDATREPQEWADDNEQESR